MSYSSLEECLVEGMESHRYFEFTLEPYSSGLIAICNLGH